MVASAHPLAPVFRKTRDMAYAGGRPRDMFLPKLSGRCVSLVYYSET